VSGHFDAAETRDPEVRAAEQLVALRAHIAHAKTTPYCASGLDVDLTDLADLAKLPVTRKSDLMARQQADPPLGGVAGAPMGEIARLFLSPGPLYEPQGDTLDHWRFARALFAAGFRAGDVVHNSFSYHLTPGGWMFDGGAWALGCTVIPAGVGNTEQQVEAIAQLRPAGFAGTPDFLKVLLDKAAEMDRDVQSITKALVSGAALPPSLRAELGERGVAVLQCYATADAGLIAYETTAEGAVVPGMVIDEDVLVEIVRPGTGHPVPPGEVGEVIVTPFARDWPLVRLATGDLSALIAEPSPCGRTGPRIKGWMGRADQAAKVKGMFVRPEQVAEVLRRHPAVTRARLTVGRADQQDTMTLACEVATGETEGDVGLMTQIADTLAAVTKLKGMVEFVPEGALPNDGKVIDDVRPVG